MAVLDLRPNCECCDRDLAPDSPDAFICTFECTFCQNCALGVLGGYCPNCLGNLVQRPIRPWGGPTGGLRKYPGSDKRVVRDRGCTEAPDVGRANEIWTQGPGPDHGRSSSNERSREASSRLLATAEPDASRHL